MARAYSRDSSGRFAGGARRGDVATTTQQNSAEHKRERRAEKAALSGGKIGTKRTKRVARTKAVGKRASTKAMRNALARARKRFT